VITTIRPVSARPYQCSKVEPHLRTTVDAHDGVQRVVGHQRRGQRIEGDGRQHARHDETAIQRTHDFLAGLCLDEDAADDGRNDREAAQHQRVDDCRLGVRLEQQRSEQHGRHDGDRVGLEQVGCHARAVAHVVAHVVGDHRRVARVIFRNAGFDLADQVRTHVGALGEDAATETREDGNQRRTEAETDQRMDDLVDRRVVCRCPLEDCIVARHPQQTHAHHQHAGDGAAAEGDIERFGNALARGFRRTHVGADRHVHADVAGSTRQHGADDEAGCRRYAEGKPQDNGEDDADDGDRPVLSVQIGLGAHLHCVGNFAHSRVAAGLRKNPLA
jgi:hypothetical protein